MDQNSTLDNPNPFADLYHEPYAISVKNIHGIGDYDEQAYKKENKIIGKLFVTNITTDPSEQKAFVVFHGLEEIPQTIEIRTDDNLKKLYIKEYESAMQSRYFGKNGIEIVMTGQIKKTDLEDLIRLSYNLTKAL